MASRNVQLQGSDVHKPICRRKTFDVVTADKSRPPIANAERIWAWCTEVNIELSINPLWMRVGVVLECLVAVFGRQPGRGAGAVNILLRR
jgi:hypothetical protein